MMFIFFIFVSYRLDEFIGLIDYDACEKIVVLVCLKLIVVGVFVYVCLYDYL